jgi:hypothetical protein
MSGGGRRPGPSALRTALATVHRDGRWWLKCLGYGAAALTGLGLPLAAGFVMESLDNSRRGYPTPLPPWGDPTLRWLTGLFCLLIDFAFIVLPLLLGGLIVLCASVGLVLAGPQGAASVNTALIVIFGGAGIVALGLFLASVAPAGRLIFARDGRIEEAISAATPRWTLGEPQRDVFLRARLASLPAYLPAALLAVATLAAARASFPGQLAAIVAGLWLTLSALVYAHLAVVQLYVGAEREIQRRALGMDGP